MSVVAMRKLLCGPPPYAGMSRVRFRGYFSTAARVWVAVPLAVVNLSAL